MKVRMKATIAGTIQGVRTLRGEVVDLPEGAATQLCQQGLAEPVAEKPEARAEKRTAKKTASSRKADG